MNPYYPLQAPVSLNKTMNNLNRSTQSKQSLAFQLKNNSNLSLRVVAATSLADWGTAAEVPVLQEAAESDQPSVKHAAQRSLKKLNARTSP